jgi:hypothetical protein
MPKVILVNQQDALEVENEEKVKWALNILETMGLPVNEWQVEPTMNNLRSIRRQLKSEDIDVIDDSNGGLEIYCMGTLIGEWRKPRYILREDPKEINDYYKYYLEMHINEKTYLDQFKD